MRKLTTKFFAAFAACALFASCTKNNADVVANDDVSPAVRQMVQNAGFYTNDLKKSGNGYLVEGDIFLTEDELASMGSNANLTNNLLIANNEQFVTNNLVSGTRTISVSLNTTQANFVSATDNAIARYNALPLRLKFQRVSGTNGNIKIQTYYQVSNTLGSAGFPSGGNPFGTISMNTYWYNTGIAVNALATTIAHEMGHCIGFRHTDYKDRSYSCGGAVSNEGVSTVGANHVPGTPTVANAGSWMLACGSTASSFNRPFTSNDQIALNYVY
jgi:hypothetical protein